MSSMFSLFCVTNRALCTEPFFARLEKLSHAPLQGIILREKDLTPSAYATYADRAAKICAGKVPLILHNFPAAAEHLHLPLQLPISVFLSLTPQQRQALSLGVSVHSVEEAKTAEDLGARWLLAGHIYATSCKPGVAPRGLAFLAQVCNAVSLPVYAIGGMTIDHLPEVQKAGAQGCCVMSAWMTCPDPKEEIAAWASAAAAL